MLIFGQKYGVINSIVLSRSGESDNVYLRDEESVAQNGLTEVKIVDNQIMNFNNRSDYLQGILNALNGLYYYLNDFNSTGILYYEVGDLYNVQIGENTYQCLMLNDEVNVTTGIEEIIHTDMPEKSETDYEKADKTDMKINKTYLIVDKQNQQIDAVVSQTIDTSNPQSIASKTARLTIRVDDIDSKIQDIADITTYGESDRAEVELTDINESEPIMIKVHPTSTNISYLYPRDNLYPSDTQYIPNRIVRFTRTYEEEGETLTEDIDYTLPDDLLRYSDTVYDEFYLNYESQTCQVIKRCAYNADGTVRALGTEITTDYPYPTIGLGEGNYTITLPGYDFGYLYARLMAKNIYTTQFYTKVETNSQINQKADEITSTVSQTYETKGNAQTNYSRIDQNINAISLEVGEKVDEEDFTGANIMLAINNDTSSATINAGKISLNGKDIDMTTENISISSTNFNVDKDGNLTCLNANINGGNIELTGEANVPKITIKSSNNDANKITIAPTRLIYYNGQVGTIQLYPGQSQINVIDSLNTSKRALTSSDMFRITDGSSTTYIYSTGIVTPTLQQTSLESEKKNFEKFNEGLNIIKDIDIYQYNLKFENNTDKKHIGFVIGNKYNYRKEITTDKNDGVDVYSFVSVCCQAIKEQQEQIEQMKKEIEELKGGK